MKKKKLLSIACILALLVCGLSACGGSSTTSSESSSTQSKEKSTNNGTSPTTWKSAYLKLAERKASWIQAYIPMSPDVTDTVIRPTALFDIDEDGVPELFLMGAVKESWGRVGTLEIYTYKDGAAKKLSYKYPTMLYDVLTDAEVGAGTNYIVYKGKNKNQFYIYSLMIDSDVGYYNVAQYTLQNGQIKLMKRLQNEYLFPDGSIDDYWINGEPVSFSTGSSSFTAAYRDISRAILYSGSDPSSSVWKNFDKSEAACMTLNQLAAKLGGSASDLDQRSGSNSSGDTSASDQTASDDDWSGGGWSDETDSDVRVACWNLATDTIKDHLKTPDDADFPFSSSSKYVLIQKKGNKYEVYSWVRSYNSYGEKRSMQFIVFIERNGNNLKAVRYKFIE